MLNQIRLLKIGFLSLLYLFFSIPYLLAEQKIGMWELDRLVKIHKPQKAVKDFDPNIGPKRTVQLLDKGDLTVFSIPGFKIYGCGECHKSEDLLDRSENRMRQTLKRLNSIFPDLTPAPLKQFIIQSWSGELLQPWQFAHTTFDSIRISPAAILIDSRVYGLSLIHI